MADAADGGEPSHEEDSDDPELLELTLGFIECRRLGVTFEHEDRLYARLHHYALEVAQRWRGAELPDDLAQEAIAVLMGGVLERFDRGVGKSARAYVRGVAKQTCRDRGMKARYVNKDPRRPRRAIIYAAAQLLERRRLHQGEAPLSLDALLSEAQSLPSVTVGGRMDFPDLAGFVAWWQRIIGAEHGDAAFPSREERIVLCASWGLTLAQRQVANVLAVSQQTVQEHLRAGRPYLRRVLERQCLPFRRALPIT